MLSTMRNFCSSAARSLRPVVCSTTVLARKAHGQAKAQPPSLPTSSGDELTLVSGELKVSLCFNFQGKYSCLFNVGIFKRRLVLLRKKVLKISSGCARF